VDCSESGGDITSGSCLANSSGIGSDSKDKEDFSSISDIANCTVYVHQEQSYIGKLSGDIETTAYRLHRVFPAHTATSTVFDDAISPILDRSLAELKGEGDERSTTSSVMWSISFGMTGSGKTHTSKECFVLTARKLLQVSKRRECQLAISMVEIRNNECFDLLDCADSDSLSGRRPSRLSLREDALGCVQLSESRWLLQSDEDISICLDEFLNHRATAVTSLNHASSRSHAVITLFFAVYSFTLTKDVNQLNMESNVKKEQLEVKADTNTDGAIEGHVLKRCETQMYPVCRILDLAGSERQRYLFACSYYSILHNFSSGSSTCRKYKQHDVFDRDSAQLSNERLAEMKSINYSLGCLKVRLV
jgi:hypothetical protein